MDSCSYTKINPVDIESYDPDMAIHNPTKNGRGIHAAVFKDEQEKRRRGCLKTCLCVTLVVVGLMVSIALLAAAGAYIWMAGHVKEWTVAEPINLPVVDVPSEDLEVFKDEAKLFFDLIQAGRAPGSFVATATNLNGLAASFDFLRGNIFAAIEENELTISLSLPMDGFPGGKGRFLVGRETLTWNADTSVLHSTMVSPPDNNDEKKTFYDLQAHLSRMDNRKWNLVVLSGEFFGCVIPQEWIDEHHNILEDLYNCDNDDEDCKHARKVLEGLDAISLEKDQVIFRGRGNEEDSAVGYRHLAPGSAELGWKFQLARRLVPF